MRYLKSLSPIAISSKIRNALPSASTDSQALLDKELGRNVSLLSSINTLAPSPVLRLILSVGFKLARKGKNREKKEKMSVYLLVFS